jgi:hypothetical protein
MIREYIEIKYQLDENECWWLSFRLYPQGYVRGYFQAEPDSEIFETHVLTTNGTPAADSIEQIETLLNKAVGWGFDEITDDDIHEAHKAIAELNDSLWR